MTFAKQELKRSCSVKHTLLEYKVISMVCSGPVSDLNTTDHQISQVDLLSIDPPVYLELGRDPYLLTASNLHI